MNVEATDAIVLNILRDGRQKIFEGWCCGSFARDQGGKSIIARYRRQWLLSPFKGGVSHSMIGALLASVPQSQMNIVDSAVKELALTINPNCLRTNPEWGWYLVSYWNDNSACSWRHALDVYDEAIQRMTAIVFA